MVLICNIVADRVLWISPTTNSIKHDVSGNKSIDWMMARWNRKTADNGKLRYYAEENLVIPVWCPQNSVLVMGGTFQENMCQWTEKREDMLKLAANPLHQIDLDHNNHMNGMREHPSV